MPTPYRIEPDPDHFFGQPANSFNSDQGPWQLSTAPNGPRYVAYERESSSTFDAFVAFASTTDGQHFTVLDFANAPLASIFYAYKRDSEDVVYFYFSTGADDNIGSFSLATNSYGTPFANEARALGQQQAFAKLSDGSFILFGIGGANGDELRAVRYATGAWTATFSVRTTGLAFSAVDIVSFAIDADDTVWLGLFRPTATGFDVEWCSVSRANAVAHAVLHSGTGFSFASIGQCLGFYDTSRDIIHLPIGPPLVSDFSEIVVLAATTSPAESLNPIGTSDYISNAGTLWSAWQSADAAQQYAGMLIASVLLPTQEEIQIWSRAATGGASPWGSPSLFWDFSSNPPVPSAGGLDFANPFNPHSILSGNGIGAVISNGTDTVCLEQYYLESGTPISLACPVNGTYTVGQPYSGTLIASGGTPPYTFSLIGGSFPPGISLNASTGVISGTSSVPGNFSYTVQVTDSVGNTATVTCSLGGGGGGGGGGSGGGGGGVGSCRTIIHLWQLARVAKPEVIQNRYGDYYDFKQASYVRGLIARLDTFGANKSISFRNADNGSLILPMSRFAPGVFNHNGEQEIAYYFDPFVTHLIREEPQDFVPWRKFQMEWIRDPWPELEQIDSPWMNLGVEGAKYLRGAVMPMDTNGQPVSLTFLSSDDQTTRTVGPFTTNPVEKTSVPWAFDIPLIGHDFQYRPNGPMRNWYDEIRWDFDPWPELINEATGWLTVLPGGGAAFLQGLILPIETAGTPPQLNLLTDTGAVIPLRATVTPPAANVTPPNAVKTGVPYALDVPTVCHQFQLLPVRPCRIWLNEIQRIAEPTPEMVNTWTTQWTGHGIKGYQHIPWIEAAFATNAAATLTIQVYDGTAPATIALPNTNGQYQKTLFALTFNKGMLYQYSVTSSAPLQIFLDNWIVQVGPWGRSGEYIQYRNLGSEQGDKARI